MAAKLAMCQQIEPKLWRRLHLNTDSRKSFQSELPINLELGCGRALGPWYPEMTDLHSKPTTHIILNTLEKTHGTQKAVAYVACQRWLGVHYQNEFCTTCFKSSNCHSNFTLKCLKPSLHHEGITQSALTHSLESVHSEEEKKYIMWKFLQLAFLAFMVCPSNLGPNACSPCCCKFESSASVRATARAICSGKDNLRALDRLGRKSSLTNGRIRRASHKTVPTLG